MEIDDEIRKYIKENTICQKTVALKMGLSESAFSLFMNKKRKLSVGEYVNLCEALCVPFERFTNKRR